MKRRALLAGGLALACGARRGTAVSRPRAAVPPARSRAQHQDVLDDLRFARPELDLPRAHNGMDPTDAPGVLALVRGLWIDGWRLDEDSASWFEGSEPKPLVQLMRILVNKQCLWWQLNPGAKGFPGVLQLWVHARVPVRGVKSLVFSATAAGYPNLSFMAWNAAAPDEVGRLFFDGRVTPSWHRTPRNEPELLVEVVSEKDVVLTWRTAGETIVRPRKMSIEELFRNAEPEWRSRGSHFTPHDPKADRVVVAVPDAMEFGTLFPVLDALSSPKRRFFDEHFDEIGPAFEVTFAVAETELPRYLATLPGSDCRSR